MTPAADMREFKGTAWFARQLGIRFEGLTGNGCRRAMIRAAILEQDRTDLHEHFERLFGVPVTTTEMQYAAEPVTL